ncbi:TlpA family protein disulfide reductase [Nocardioides jishulii]|uniref:TlpA family protein disulfide reductase n=1 Tax=Nocardioides jishulii TaxID=2575440 RepID=A0A4V5TM45_9ACTN|nr:TlpA disulfide reductase family protein [Nocardioides jishulii]QCX28820.1 TlpA family protein disulfide reductase [Nocardioides jishulii]TKI64283.1 TlpA family protein disulfide reductase [Nocardioides jishulii]
MTRPARRTPRLRARMVALVAVLTALTLTGCTPGGVDGESTSSSLPAPMPDLTLPGFAGQPSVDLADLDSPTVVSLWASWCTPCRKEMPILEEFSKKYEGRVDVLGVDYQDAQSKKAEKFVAEVGATYPMVVDLDGELDGRDPMPRVPGLPFLAFVDADGDLVGVEMQLFDDLAELEEIVERHLDLEAAT